ncbi:cyclic pyranopterin monophosphate synthase MoaC [Ruminococcaceae bacterium OttesenSCG-928-I18]|nr:cyclic pyranopterin monophosphate synthase MoaC [Ruminococcaceae bacterium OttesenSCG-928-I18]
MPENQSNHFDAAGKAIMVDVSGKEETLRIAVAGGKITLNDAALQAVSRGTAKKGDVLGVARVAGIMGLKRTSSLIPLCHPMPIDKASIDFSILENDHSIEVVCTVQTTGKTGVEMEALCGANIALLTIYDMCKSLDKGMVIGEVRLFKKQGGKSGDYQRNETDNL